MPSRKAEWGFGLLGVLVLVALMAVATASVGVLLLKQMDAQRQVETQGRLKTAFTGLFGGPSARGASMRKDFAYNPSVPGSPPVVGDLSAMVLRSAVGNTDAGNASVPQFDGTQIPPVRFWNGPYWAGPRDSQNRPVDGWGRPLQLRYVSTASPAGWQVFSLGANGVSETGDSGIPAGDDQVFPIPPYAIPTISVPGFSLTISVSGLGPGNNHYISVFVTDANGTIQIPELISGSYSYQMHSNGSGKPSSGSWSQAISVATPPGTVTIDIRDGGTSVAGWPKTYTITATTPMPMSISLP